MLNNYKQLTVRYMKKEKGNSIAIFISIVLTISLITSIVVILDNNMKNEYARLKRDQGEYDVRLQNIDQDKLQKINDSTNTKDYTAGKSEGIVNIQNGNGAYSLVEVYNLSQKAYDETFGFKINYGRMPENSNEVLIHGGIINKLGQYYKIGDTIKVDVETNRNIEMYNYYTIYARSISKPIATENLNYTGDVMDDFFPKLIKETKEYKVVGIVDVGENNVLWENRILGLLTDEEQNTSDGLEVYTTLTNGKNEEALANEIGIRYIGRTISSNIFGVEASDVKYPGYVKTQYQGVLNNGDNLFLLGFVSIFILAAIYNAFHISISKKIKNYGILRAVGATMGQISYLIIKEAIIIFILAIPVGFIVGIFGLKLELYVLNRILNINNTMNTTLDVSMIIAILQVVSITIIYAVAISIRKEGKLTPVDAISGAMNLKRPKKIEAKNFLGQSIEDVDNDDGELEIKKILDFDETTFKYKIMKKLFKFEGGFAHKNITRNPSRNRLCIITLTSTMIMIILFLVQTINGNIASEFIRSSDMWDVTYISEVDAITSEDMKDIENIQGVNGVYRNIESMIPIVVEKDKINKDFEKIFKNSGIKKEYENKLALNSSLRAVEEDSLKYYEQYLLEGSLDKEKLDDNGVILVNKATNFYVMKGSMTNTPIFIDMIKPLKYTVGEEILIPLSSDVMNFEKLKDYTDNNNGYKKVKVVGIISEDAFKNNLNTRDFKNLNSNVSMITSENTYDYLVGPSFKNQLFISTDINEERSQTIKNLEVLSAEKYAALKDYKTMQEDIRDENLKDLSFNIIFTLTVMLLVVLNLINTLTANILSRKGELAALSAIGMSNKQKQKMIVAESFYIGLASAIFALLIGGLPAVIFQGQNSDIGKVSLPILILIVVGIVIALALVTVVISLVPLNKLKKMNIVDTLKEDI